MSKTHIIEGIEFSEETVKGWAKQCGISFEKPKFEPIRLCHLRISVDGRSVKMGWHPSKNYTCMCDTAEIRKHITALQSAIDFIEK